MAKKPTKKEVLKRGKDDACGCKGSSGNSCGGGIYGLGFLGAIVYYISTATSFWMGALGILKALVWPAFIIYEALKYFSA